jgi:PAP2 superfamily protein
MTWQLAVELAAVVGIPALLWRPKGRKLGWVAAGLREIAVVLALFGLWQIVGGYAKGRAAGALAHGQWIWHAERVVHIPSEVTLQQQILGHSWLVQACNAFYIYGHFNGLILLLVWVWVRHRDRYGEVRWLVVLTTAACLFVQLIPVAPPRLIGGHHIVDTGLVYGQSVYPAGGGLADQSSAMPSVHVAWALIVGLTALMVTRSRWRYLALLHPIVTVYVVVVTGNHYWFDGLAAAILLAMSWLVIRAGYRVRTRLRIRRSPIDLEAAGIADGRLTASRSASVSG